MFVRLNDHNGPDSRIFRFFENQNFGKFLQFLHHFRASRGAKLLGTNQNVEKRHVIKPQEIHCKRDNAAKNNHFLEFVKKI